MAAPAYVRDPTRLSVSSSQSNTRCADSSGEPTWQWSSAPSPAVKSWKVLSQVRIHSPLRGAAVGDDNWVPCAVGGVRVTGGWGLLP